MNKQELAATLWESANTLRANIDASQYKDYILGFIFYRYLSEKELRLLKSMGVEEGDLEYITEDDPETVKGLQDELGYFISYENLFSTWLAMDKKSFNVKNVQDGLNAFDRLISDKHRMLFKGIFKTLQTGLSSLGADAAAQTKAVRNLMDLIKKIPMGNTYQDYDVLGYIYEYLISMFAANAGKKAGEFYTPHEVSMLMADIVADHTKGKDHIEIYDPTSGSGSLLITIGHAAAKYMKDGNSIKYYAQELKENTFNLTRMNLVMRNILPDNIEVRNADTLEKDWPWLDKYHETKPLYLDGVVSNPPYSQSWDPKNKENDPRFAGFGLAPKTKADYAFLLHDLYHLKPDGIMTIVLPHGVLFRGNEEGEIRRNLVEKNHIDTIIGLPPNIFYGTSIPTIIMVLRQKREARDILFIDASKGFEKVGKDNKLRARDIKKIVDTYKGRLDIPKYSRKVSIDEIRKNDYNLNIPRYVDSSEEAEHWDIYSIMNSGLSEEELGKLDPYWQIFPTLKETLFKKREDGYFIPAVVDVRSAVKENEDVKEFETRFSHAFDGMDRMMEEDLISSMETIPVAGEEEKLAEEIFSRLKDMPLIDPYEAYQILDDAWKGIAADLETIQTEGKDVICQVLPHMVTKKKKGKDTAVQEGWTSRIIPFALLQHTFLAEDLKNIEEKEKRIREIQDRYASFIEEMPEEDKESLLNDSNDAFDMKTIQKKAKEIYEHVETDEIRALEEYLPIRSQKEKLAFIAVHPEVSWNDMKSYKDGTYGKPAVQKRLKILRMEAPMEEGTTEDMVIRVLKMAEEEKALKKEIKSAEDSLTDRTKNRIEKLSPEEEEILLKAKWIQPLRYALEGLSNKVVVNLEKEVQQMADKYKDTYRDIDEEIRKAESSLASMMGELTGPEKDMEGLRQLAELLGGKV